MIDPGSLEVVLSWVLRVTVVTGLALAMTPLLRHHSAHWRHLFWAVTLISCLVPPLLRWPGAGVPLPVSLSDDEPRGALLWTVLTALYGLGVLVALLLTWRQVVAARTLRASAEQPVPAASRQLLQHLATCLGISRPPDLRVGHLTGGAVLVGWKQPTILLPQRFVDELSPSALSCVLGHELVHHGQRDLRWNALRCLACVVWWFHPLVWIVARRHLMAREECCDATVILRLQRSAADYARSLVEAARLTTVAVSLPGMAFVGRSESALMQRVRRLPQHHLGHVGLRTKILLAVLTVFLVLPTWVSPPTPASAQGNNTIWNSLLHDMQLRHANAGAHAKPRSHSRHSRSGHSHQH